MGSAACHVIWWTSLWAKKGECFRFIPFWNISLSVKKRLWILTCNGGCLSVGFTSVSHIFCVSFDNSLISTISFKWQDFRKTGWYVFGGIDFTNRLVLEFFLYFCAAACVSRSNSPHGILAGREHTSYSCICTHLCVVVHIICALRMKVGLFQSCLSIKTIRQGFSACHLSATLPRHPAL